MPALSQKQLQYLELLASGVTGKEAAFQVGWTYGTSKVMIMRIRRALGAETTHQAVAIYVKRLDCADCIVRR